jgi:hypothetical protein
MSEPKSSITHDTKHKKVIVQRGSVRVVLSKDDFDARVAELSNWYAAKKLPKDHYGGAAAAMYDPNGPYPQTFSHRVCERWTPSNSKNGKCVTKDRDPVLLALHERSRL